MPKDVLLLHVQSASALGLKIKDVFLVVRFVLQRSSMARFILGTVIPSLPEEDRAGVLPENSEHQENGWMLRGGRQPSSVVANREPFKFLHGSSTV